MTRQLDNREKRRGKAHQCAQPSTPDPRLVALVKYLARRAAERDHIAIQNASPSEVEKSGGISLDNAGADS